MIESVNNERVKSWVKLNEKKFQIREKLFLVEGEHLVEEAHKCGYLKEVIILDGWDFPYENKTFVTETVMRKISNLKNVPRIIGVSRILTPRKIKGTVLMLDKISDPGNLGTIIRSSVAFGVDTIILGIGCVSLYNHKVVRATEGMLFHINIIEKPLEDAIEDLKVDGYKIYSTNVDAGTNLEDISFQPKTAIVMGSEGAGVDYSISNLSHEFLYIPMNESCESLNVGVATSIILYELHKKIGIK